MDRSYLQTVDPETPLEVSWKDRQWSQTPYPIVGESSSDSAERLILHVSASGPDPENVAKSIREYVSECLAINPRHTRADVLGSAIKAIGTGLYEENRVSPDSENQRASIACLLYRGNEASVAVAGDTSALRLHSGGLEIITASAAGRLGRASELGSAENPPLRVVRYRLRLGERVILTDSSFIQIAPRRLLAALAAAVDQQALAASIRNISMGSPSTEDFRAVVVTTMSSPKPFASSPWQVPAPQAGMGGDQHLDDKEKVDQYQLDTPGGSDFGISAAMRRLPVLFTLISPQFRLILISVIAFAIGFFLVYTQIRATQETDVLSEVAAIRSRLSELEDQATSIVDPGERREVLLQAGQLADRLSQYESDDSEIAESARRIRNRLDDIAGVARPSQAPIVVTVDGRPDVMVLAGAELFLLDRIQGVIHRFQLTPAGSSVQAGSDNTLLRAGDSVGNYAIGDLLDILWMTAGSIRRAGGLLVFDSNGKVLDYQPGTGITTLDGQSPDGGIRITAMASFGGAIYAYDSQSGQVIWIAPTQSGYSRRPYRYFEPGIQIDQSDVVDLAMDGDLFLLHESGEISRYYAGKPVPFRATVPNGPLIKPVQFEVTRSSIYVLDPATTRVVQFSREGELVRQFQLGEADSSLTAVSQIAVDENGGRLYLLNGSHVHVLPLKGG